MHFFDLINQIKSITEIHYRQIWNLSAAKEYLADSYYHLSALFQSVQFEVVVWDFAEEGCEEGLLDLLGLALDLEHHLFLVYAVQLLR